MVIPMTRGKGFGAYEDTGNWTWEYYPPPYDFLGPSDPAVVAVPVLYAADFGGGLAGFKSGVGDCGCGGSCGGCGDHSHEKGMGALFDSWDMSTWGWGEWAIVGVLAYGGISLLSDTKRTASAVTKKVRRSKSAARRRAELKEELAGL